MGLGMAVNNKSQWNWLSEIILQRMGLFHATMCWLRGRKNVTGEILWTEHELRGWSSCLFLRLIWKIWGKIIFNVHGDGGEERSIYLFKIYRFRSTILIIKGSGTRYVTAESCSGVLRVHCSQSAAATGAASAEPPLTTGHFSRQCQVTQCKWPILQVWEPVYNLLI